MPTAACSWSWVSRTSRRFTRSSRSVHAGLSRDRFHGEIRSEAHHRARVLIVEDDLACRILAALLLERGGYAPTAVPTVARALERLEHEGTDLVLTDLQLPGESGLDLLQTLRERRSSTPVIVMTGSDDPELIDRALELGAATVIHKPYSTEWLHAAVGAALEGLPAVA